MTEILFIRHGQTQANTTGHWQGWSDPPLTACGRAQAKAIARRLAPQRGQVTALYTSPLSRALETAQALGATLGLQPTSVEALKEINFGQLEGLTLQEMEGQFPDLYARWHEKTDMAFEWPGGERRIDFFSRAAEACRGIIARHPEEKVVIVAHGGTIRACLAALLPRQLGQWWGYTLDNAGLTRIRVTENNTDLLVLNDASHLHAGKDR